jgi:hypothetical protein
VFEVLKVLEELQEAVEGMVPLEANKWAYLLELRDRAEWLKDQWVFQA